MEMDIGYLPDCDEIEGLDAPPRMSQEINPQNLADLFADDPACNAPANNFKTEGPLSQQVSRAMAFAGAGIDDEFEMKKLQVFVRIRPTATNNAAINASTSHWDAENCIHAAAKHTLAIAAPEGSMAYKAGDRGQTFTFSQVFEAETTQEEYFSATAAPMVDDLLRNPQHNSVMMAYGITAAGKTYTIEGTKSAPGVVPRALQSLFDGIARHMDAELLAVRVSYCEIYNEAVYDLIEEAHNGWVQKRPALKLMEDARGRVSVSGLSEVEVTSAEEALGVLRRGAKHRQRAETGLNFSSSRSHSIFGVHLVRRQEAPAAAVDNDEEESVRKSLATTSAAVMKPVKVERLGRMSFVDLAGSERAQRTGNVGIRLKESVAINSSLMTLGRCLEALRWNQQQQNLSRNGNAAAAGPLKVVPYRESKVTHLFRDALHGYGRVVLSVNVSPCAKDYDETAHVLRYASLATAIGTLQQAEAPRRTIKAVTPGALRRAKRKAAAKVAKDEAAKKAKKAAEAAEEAEKAAREAEMAKAAAEAAEPTPSVVQNTVEPSTANRNGEVDGDEAAIGTTATSIPAPASAPPSSAAAALPLATAGTEGEEEVVYEVMGRRLLSDEFDNVAAEVNNHQQAQELLREMNDEYEAVDIQQPVLEGEEERGFSLANASASPSFCHNIDAVAEGEGEEMLEFEEQGAADTPSTPCSDGYNNPEGEEGDEDEALAALQAQVQQLLQELQAAEERAVLLEGEVREEVAGEMAGLLKDMEESYRERLTAEVAAAEARAAKNAAAKNNAGGGGKGAASKKKGGGGRNGKRGAASETEDNDENMEPSADQLFAEETAKALEKANLEIASLRAELDLHQAEAREQAERLVKAQEIAASARAEAVAATEELGLMQARADCLAAALAESRRSSEDIVEDRLREQVTQLGANAAMELEMAEQQAERLRKENMSLRQQLAAAMVTLETISSPSIPMLQRMAAACPAGVGGGLGGNGCGAGGTPHDLALARARHAAAAEEAAALVAAAAAANDAENNTLPHISASSQGRSTGHRSTGPQKSRFGEEALALAAANGTQITDPGAVVRGLGLGLGLISQPEEGACCCGDKTPAHGALHSSPAEADEEENLHEKEGAEADCNDNEMLMLAEGENEEEEEVEEEVDAMLLEKDVFGSEAVQMEEEEEEEQEQCCDHESVEAALRALEEAKAEAEQEVKRLMELAQQEQQQQQHQQQEAALLTANKEEEEEDVDIITSVSPVQQADVPPIAADMDVANPVEAENEEEVLEKTQEESVEQQECCLPEELPAVAEEDAVPAEEEKIGEEVQPKRRGRKKATKQSKKSKAVVVEEEQEEEKIAVEQQPAVKRGRRGRKPATAVVEMEMEVEHHLSNTLEPIKKNLEVEKRQQEEQEDVAVAEVLPVVVEPEPAPVETAEEQEEKEVKPASAAKAKGRKRGRKPKAAPLAVEEEPEVPPVCVENAVEEEDEEEVVLPVVKKQTASQRLVLEDSEEEEDQVLSVAKPRARLHRHNIVDLLDSSSDEEEEEDQVLEKDNTLVEEIEEAMEAEEDEEFVEEQQEESHSEFEIDLDDEEEEPSSEEEEEDTSDADYDPSFEEEKEEEEEENGVEKGEAQQQENASEPALEEAISPVAAPAPVEEAPRRQTRRASRAISASTSTLDMKFEKIEDKVIEEKPASPKPAPAPVAAPAPAPVGRKRRLLQVSKPLSTEMRYALGDLAGADLPGGVSLASKRMPVTKKGTSMAVALGLSPAPARQRTPKRSRRPLSIDLE